MNGDCNCLELCRSTLLLQNRRRVNQSWFAVGDFTTGIANLRLISYILVELAPGTAKKAAEAISKIEGIKTAHAVTGPFDVIAYAEVPDLTTLSDLVLAKIQNVKGVQKTQTAVVVTPDILEPGPTPTRKNKSRKSP